jgi:DNA-binding transcriptional LysR family regulator
MDWSLVQSFLAVAETGSLSAAARETDQSQPTVGRHIRALEAQLQVELFQRHSKGLRLTEAGADLMPDAKAMRAHLNRMALTAAGKGDRVEGTVRLTASVFIAHHVLPPILAELRHGEPGIQIELVASDDSDNLLFREADIALRMYRPTQLDIVAQSLGKIGLGLYARRDVAERLGPAQEVSNLFDAGFIGFDANPQMIESMRRMGLDVTPESFAVRTDHQTVYWQLVKAGCGLGFCQRQVAEADPEIVEIDIGYTIPPLELWLATPEALRNVPRIRRVWTLLHDALKAHIAGER